MCTNVRIPVVPHACPPASVAPTGFMQAIDTQCATGEGRMESRSNA